MRWRNISGAIFFMWPGDTNSSPSSQAWARAHRASAMVARGEAVRIPMGYLHSSLGFYYLMLLSIWFVFGFYQHWRYKVGLRRLLPGARV